jgi:hypothetical protein
MPPEMPSVTPPPVSAVPQDILDAILTEAARLSGAPREQVAIVRADAVVWNDGSLGCPEPGMEYIQVLVDGYWVVLQAGETQFDFRVDRTGNFKLCVPRPGMPSPSIEIPPPMR